jgi:hypothetical protein
MLASGAISVVPEQPFDPKGVQGGSSQNLGSFFVALLVDA